MNAEDDFLVIYSKLLPFILIEKLAKKKKIPENRSKELWLIRNPTWIFLVFETCFILSPPKSALVPS